MKFLSESTRKVDGRYEIPLIWCDNNVNLPDNFAAAARRLEFLEKRLGRDPELAANYEKSIDMDIGKGYIKRLTEEEADAPIKRKWYLPHHPVVALRFLWRQCPESPIEVYQYVRHIFGAKCAPTCCNYMPC